MRQTPGLKKTGRFDFDFTNKKTFTPVLISLTGLIYFWEGFYLQTPATALQAAHGECLSGCLTANYQRDPQEDLLHHRMKRDFQLLGI